ncbi:MAG TPA: carboxypeptidase regulatory-like domain-containing protein [Terriglobales bacterium]
MQARRISLILLSLAVVLTMATVGFAQTGTTGDLSGTVTDASGAVVANATVTLKDEAHGQVLTQKSNGQGEFRFTLLRPAAYTLTVEAAGLQKSVRNVTVNLGQVNAVPVKLNVAGTSTTVEVTSETPLIQTENANMATTYNAAQLSDIPVPGNDITAYAYTAPGVVLNTGSGYGNFSSFGLPSTANLFTTNGNDNMDPYLNLNNSGASNLALGSNELGEIAVVSNGYTAQYGRQAGAHVDASTKSGTNQFHGNALYWWNGRALNANEWFLKQSQIAAGDPNKQAFSNNNQWAASFGGPIVKNKLFFFFDTEGLRYVLPGAGGAIYIPTTQFAQYVQANVAAMTPGSGPFYQNMLNLYANAPGANRATALTAADDPALGCGDFAGTAGFGTTIPCAAQFRSTQNNLNKEWLLSTRIDWNISNNDRLNGRFRTDHGVQATGTDPINPAFNANSVQPEYEGQITENHIFNSTTVNNFILSGMWYSAIFGPPDIAAALKVFPTTMQFGDGLLATLGGGDSNYPQGRIVSQYQITDNFTKSVGRHDLGFGVNYRRNLVSDYTTGVNSSGLLTVNSMTEFVDGQFQGNGSTYNQAFPTFGATRIKLYTLGFYGQDQWKATSKLQLTMALRIDRNSNPSCSQNCFARLVAPFSALPHDTTVPYNQVIQTGLSNAFPSIQPIVWNPRFGAAYNIFPNTVIRGGIGLFSDLFPGTLVDRFITNAPNDPTFGAGQTGAIAFDVPGNIRSQASNSAAVFQQGFAGGATLAQLQGLLPGFTSPTFSDVNSQLLNPNFLEWNFQIEQQLGKDYSFSVNYVGNHGYDVMTANPWSNAYCRRNCPFGGVGGSLPNAAPDARFAEIQSLYNSGWSNYNGVTTTFKMRYGSQFQANFNYTWSHALDTCSNSCLLPFTANSNVSMRYLASPGLPGTAYGNSDYDVRQNFSANYVYNTKSNWSNGFEKAALGGWTVAGTIYYHSGYPWSPVNTTVRGYLNNVTGLRTATPLGFFLGGTFNQGGCGNPNIECVSPSQFLSSSVAPQNGIQSNFGNIARGTFSGAGYFDTDMNVTKNFKIKERMNFAIGANFFNLFNHPNFDLPSNSVNGGVFGQVLNTVVPATTPYGAFAGVTLSGRIIQMNARFSF